MNNSGAEFLENDVGIKNPYRDPDIKRNCSKIYEMSKKLWGDHLPEKWGTDQLGFSAPKPGRRTIYGKYIKDSPDSDKFKFVAKCIYDTRTIGGCFIWPKVYREGLGNVSEYNNVRGGYKGNKGRKYFLEDRVDVALLEIQHFFKKKEEYKSKDYEEFINKYISDESKASWMIFDYTSHYPSNKKEYEIMYEWLCKFDSFKDYCKFFSFFDVFVVERDNSIQIIDIAKSDLQNKIIKFLSEPVTESIYKLPAEDIRRMLMNLCQLVNKRNMKIIEKAVNL